MADLAVSVLDGLTRATPLVINAPAVTTPCEATVSETLTARATTASGVLYDASGSAVAQGLHPRTYLTPSGVTALRAQLASDSVFRDRWQTAVTQFESAGGYWATNTVDPYNNAFGAFLACIRRSDDDVGLTWASSWTYYRDRVVAQALVYATTPMTYPPVVWSVAMTYDLLYHDLTAAERIPLATATTLGANNLGWVGLQWNDQTAEDHCAKVIASMASEDASGRLALAITKTQEWAEAREWMSHAGGVGYEWKNGYITNLGPDLALFILRTAADLTDAETWDRLVTQKRDAWQLNQQFVIPHPSWLGPSPVSFTDRLNMTQPDSTYHRTLNVGANLIWSLALLPGRLNLTTTQNAACQTTLATSEAAYFGALRYAFDDTPLQKPTSTLRNVLNFKWLRRGSPTPTEGRHFTFYTFPPWLLLNAQEAASVAPEVAGIPLVRRWWPGTLEWTTIRSSFSHASSSLITYHHRRYYVTAYEEGCRQNGSWHVHRDGPLLVQRGNASHSIVGRKRTWATNGTVMFRDTAQADFVAPETFPEDYGQIRGSVTASTKAESLANLPESDFGEVTAWYATPQVVAITSDLTRSYGSTVYLNAGNTAKISAFTREFVCVQRGGDGSDHERVFTYDRLTILGGGRYHPEYHLAPADDPDIDGVETAYTPWHPQATGPVRWDYSGATRLRYDNIAAPATTPSGNGQVCVTWLRPSGTGVVIRKFNGFNVTLNAEPGSPHVGPWMDYAESGADSWPDVNTPTIRPYVGLYGVAIVPTIFDANQQFLVACDVLAASDTPDLAEEVVCDSASVAARCGASVMVCGVTAGQTRTAGFVVLPVGVTLVVVVNLVPSAARTLIGSGGLTVSTTSPAWASNTGVLVVGVSGSGTLTWS